ncbi:MSCRAMM family adhesin SdrC [Halomonas sp. H33-56]|uniref:hypothetical protein n=1 Tax=Halomonas sp. H33-56 TaxID=2950873 RepID=UPI0032E043EB
MLAFFAIAISLATLTVIFRKVFIHPKGRETELDECETCETSGSDIELERKINTCTDRYFGLDSDHTDQHNSKISSPGHLPETSSNQGIDCSDQSNDEAAGTNDTGSSYDTDSGHDTSYDFGSGSGYDTDASYDTDSSYDSDSYERESSDYGGAMESDEEARNMDFDTSSPHGHGEDNGGFGGREDNSDEDRE